MTIEERVTWALSELEELLKTGIHLDSALEQAARAVELRPDVIRVRATRVWGNLEDAQARFIRQETVAASLRRFVRERPHSTASAEFGAWFQAEFAQELSPVEAANCARELEMRRQEIQERWYARQLMQLAQLRDEDDSEDGGGR